LVSSVLSAMSASIWVLVIAATSFFAFANISS
jgi:hypothetical protein